MASLGSRESVVSVVDDAIFQIQEMQADVQNGNYAAFSDQPTFGVENGGTIEDIEHMRDFEPTMMFEADYHYANDELNYGTIYQGQSERYHTNYDRNVLLTWMKRYNSIGLNLDEPGLDFNFGAYFTIRHYLDDWESEPALETSEMAQKLDILSRQVGEGFASTEHDAARTPDDIDISHLLDWFDDYVGVGIFPDVAALLVIRHLRNDWAEWAEHETNELVQDLIERSSERDQVTGTDDSATSSTIFSAAQMLGADVSPMGAGTSDELVYWPYD